MKRLFAGSAVTGLGIILGMLLSPGLADQAATSPRGNKANLTSLLTERRDTLRQLAEEFTKRYQQGQISYAPVSQATIDWLHAELELAPDKAARVALHERIVEHFREREKAFSKELLSGVGQNSDLLIAKAARLQAQVDLLREEARD